MYCKKCGNFIDENKDKFCMNCGMKIDEDDVVQVEMHKESVGDIIFYYAAEALSFIFLFIFFIDLYYGNEMSAVKNLLWFIAFVNMHKIAISRIIESNKNINLVSIILEKLVGLPVNLLEEPSYIYNNAKKRNTKLNIALAVICIILANII